MNIIDLVAICPFYISLILEGLEDFEIIGKTSKMIRLVRLIIRYQHLTMGQVRIMRILRIFKLVRHFAGLQSLFYTLQQAYQVCAHFLCILGKPSQANSLPFPPS